MNVFILDTVKVLVPKNSGLRVYRDLALKKIDVPNKKLLEVRGEDIPLLLEQFLRNGQSAIGMTGEDLFKEYEYSTRTPILKVLRRVEWNDSRAMFGKPTICLLGSKKSSLDDLPKELTVAINRKYRLIAKRALNLMERNSGFVFKKIYTKGMSEMLFSEGLSNLVIDIVYTGRSIQEAGLCVYEKIFSSDFVILCGKDG